MAATIDDRTVGTPPVSGQRERWRTLHGGLIADTWPDVDSELYGLLEIRDHVVEMIYALFRAINLEDDHLRIQMTTARVTFMLWCAALTWIQIMIEDLAHKAAKKCSAVATDKGMNEYGQIIRWHILSNSKSMSDLRHQDALFANRLHRNARVMHCDAVLWLYAC